jgi:hypothetical protein
MNAIVIGVIGYFALIYIKGEQLNAAMATCPGTAVTPATCPGYAAAQAKWAWLPTPSGL